MSDKMKLLVLHPHHVGATSYNPGDTLEMDADQFEKVTSEHPFAYYHVMHDTRNPSAGKTMATGEEPAKAGFLPPEVNMSAEEEQAAAEDLLTQEKEMEEAEVAEEEAKGKKKPKKSAE